MGPLLEPRLYGAGYKPSTRFAPGNIHRAGGTKIVIHRAAGTKIGPTTPTGVYFLQIRFLRLAYDQGTVKMVAQEQVKGMRILAPEELRWHQASILQRPREPEGLQKRATAFRLQLPNSPISEPRLKGTTSPLDNCLPSTTAEFTYWRTQADRNSFASV